MNRKILKVMYKLKHEGNLSAYDISKAIKEGLGVIVSRSKVSKYLKLSKSLAKEKYTEHERELILYLYKHCYSVDKMIWYVKKRLDIELTKIALASLASKKGVKRVQIDRTSTKFLNKTQELKVVSLYKQGKSSVELSKLYGFKTHNSILQVLEKYGIERRTLQENVITSKTYSDFSLAVIDNKFKAYFVGLLLTDGYVCYREKDWQYYLQLTLTDEDAIKFVAETIGTNYRVLDRSNRGRKTEYRLQIHGKNYIEQVERYGLVQRKSKIIPGVVLLNKEVKFLSYLIRAAIDGDGWVRKDGREFYISTASEQFANWLQKAMTDLGFAKIKVTSEIQSPGGKKITMYYVRTARAENIKLLKDIVYNKPYGMERKYNRVHGLNSCKTFRDYNKNTLIGKVNEVVG